MLGEFINICCYIMSGSSGQEDEVEVEVEASAAEAGEHILTNLFSVFMAHLPSYVAWRGSSFNSSEHFHLYFL